MPKLTEGHFSSNRPRSRRSRRKVGHQAYGVVDMEARVNLARRRYTRAGATRAMKRPGSATATEAECCCLGFLISQCLG
ncbi:hypothetical protein ES332_D01G157600v1 [Gossypium tomentosum]|uniref:Uncharacterized protein n=1 Tax=Gossypium tomentosum TaxID=34277 RepID=A0A5D2M9Q2_GOSTO|nr:hypothetical protein ES332_D01G157600v1 [Gossypium tomentosum]